MATQESQTVVNRTQERSFSRVRGEQPWRFHSALKGLGGEIRGSEGRELRLRLRGEDSDGERKRREGGDEYVS